VTDPAAMEALKEAVAKARHPAEDSISFGGLTINAAAQKINEGLSARGYTIVATPAVVPLNVRTLATAILSVASEPMTTCRWHEPPVTEPYILDAAFDPELCGEWATKIAVAYLRAASSS
jgi:hypothetical protein